MPVRNEDIATVFVEIADLLEIEGGNPFRIRAYRNGARTLLRLPGLGPKRVHALYHELDIHTLEQLERAARNGLVQHLPGFGAKTEAHILDAIQAHADTSRRFKLVVASLYAEPLVDYLKTVESVTQVQVAGSYRRARSIADFDNLHFGVGQARLAGEEGRAQYPPAGNAAHTAGSNPIGGPSPRCLRKYSLVLTTSNKPDFMY